MKKLISLLLLAVFCAACTAPENPDDNTGGTKKDELTFAGNIIPEPILGSGSSSSEISFTATAPWRIEVSETRAESWCTVSPDHGEAGDATVTLTVNENETYDGRSATVKIICGSINQEFTVTQVQKDAIVMAKNEYSIEGTGGTFELELSTNIEYEITISEDWVTYVQTKALHSETVEFMVAANDADDAVERECSITFSSQNVSQSITVRQGVHEKFIYRNDFDKETASKTADGDVNGWPYLDKFDGWMNHSGKGSKDVTYAFLSVSAQASGSDGNELFMGDAFLPYLTIKDISLDGVKDLAISFDYSDSRTGKEHNSPSIYFSLDNEIWAGLADWNAMTYESPDESNYHYTVLVSVPEGTQKLTFTLQANSYYILDNIEIKASEKPGSELDMAYAGAMDFAAGSISGTGESSGNPERLTIREFRDTPVNNIEQYIVKGRITYINAQRKDACHIEDETGTIFIPDLLNCNDFVTLLNLGDEVELIGRRGHFSTSVTLEEAVIISCDGETLDDMPSLMTTAEFREAPEGEVYRVGGYITQITNGTFGNFYIKDATGNAYVYGTLNSASEPQKFAEMGINEGDIVTVVGTKAIYNGVHELVDVKIDKHYSVSDVTVADFLSKENNDDIYYRLHGTVSEITNTNRGELTLADESGSILVYALGAGWNDRTYRFMDLDINVGDEITVVGQRYSHNNGKIQEVCPAFLVSKVQEEAAVIDATAAEINAAEDGNTIYRLTGIVSEDTGSVYGNIYITDHSGTVYVYGVLDAEDNKKQWHNMGVNEGDIITITGPKSTYKENPQIKDAHVEMHKTVEDISVSEFLSKEISEDTYYQLTGTVSNLKNVTYGNFDLVDETGSIYVYGVLSGWGGPKKQFQSLGINEGDTITLIGTRGEYKESPQVISAFYVSHETKSQL